MSLQVNSTAIRMRKGYGMDWSHFGLERQPFRPFVDTDSYFPAPTHEAAIVAIAASFARRDPVFLLDGSSGTGKTLVARRWLEHLVPDVPRIVVPNPCAQRPEELLQAILFDLQQPYQGLTPQELRLAVTEQLFDQAASGYPTVLVIDEAQNLGPLVFEELRLLGNLETREGLALYTLLIAQPSLRDELQLLESNLFWQRVATRARLEPLDEVEAADYIRHQVNVAGGFPDQLFAEEALLLLAASCSGLPRLLSRAAARALELAASERADQVDMEATLEALVQLGLEPVDASDDQSGHLANPVLLPHPAQSAEPARSLRRKEGQQTSRDEADPPRGPKERIARKRTA